MLILYGTKNPPVTLVEFADYECPYCQKITPELKKLEKEYGDQSGGCVQRLPAPHAPHFGKSG